MMDEYAYLGKCPYSFSCNQFKKACVGKCPEQKSYPKSLFFDRSKKIFEDKKKAYQCFENIVFTGPGWVVDRAKQSALLRGKRIKTLDEPIDFESCFYPRNTEKLRSDVYPLANTTMDTTTIVPSVVIVVLIERVSDCVQPAFASSLIDALGISDLFSLILS